MLATLLKLELSILDDLSRDQLIRSLLQYRDALSLDFTPSWLEGHSTECLRLLLLAAKLLRVLRQKESREFVRSENKQPCV
jgi:hypothetical protein